MRRSAVLLVLLVSVSCASARRPAPARERFPLDPREELAGPFPSTVEAGWEALLAGDAGRARLAFERGGRQGGLAARIGAVEALVIQGSVSEALKRCRDLLAPGDATAPLLTACGEAHARGKDPVAAFELYRRAVARAGAKKGLKVRAEELKALASEKLRREAEARAAARNWKGSRAALARAIEIDPDSSALREAAGDIEREAGDRARAIARYREAADRDASNRSAREKLGELALGAGEYGLAVSAFESLAAQNPAFQRRAEEARLAFRVANWPAPEREAARASRLTRAEAALLLWWMVPEVREARVSTGVIASDVLDRKDSRAITRAVALGFLDVDRETHRASPDAALTRFAAARLLLRVLAILRPETRAPCLPGEPAGAVPAGADAVRAARACGLLKEKETMGVSGGELTGGLDRARALATGAGGSSDYKENGR